MLKKPCNSIEPWLPLAIQCQKRLDAESIACQAMLLHPSLPPLSSLPGRTGSQPAVADEVMQTPTYRGSGYSLNNTW